MIVHDNDYDRYLMHYGTPRHSGRYPWGSGENPYQRNANFRGHVLELRKQGLTDTEIAKGMGMTRNELQARISQANAENRAADKMMAEKLLAKGYSVSAIGRRMGKNESSVRSLLNSDIQDRKNQSAKVADQLESLLKKKGGYLDVGLGVEQYLGENGVSQYTLQNALSLLKARGYNIHTVYEEQVGTRKNTAYKVLTPEDVTKADVYRNRGDIQLPIDSDTAKETGRSVLGVEKPKAVDPKRIQIRYADDVGPDGAKGIEKDGVIELRRGVDDISLGAANYAQVRINVGDTHYLKGMAIYSDDMPKGVDIIFNTNKHRDVPMISKDGGDSVLKKMKTTPEGDVDWDNPFGATIKREDQLLLAQRYYTDKNGKRQLSAINVVNEEGTWEKWSKTLSSQFLSKQTVSMAKKQLKLVADAQDAYYEEIMSLTNPTVKKKLLMEFAGDCDSKAVHLKAAALPRQGSYVLLPIKGVKETEVYAPNYKNGEQVALVRHPHAGRFEIPILTVNNNNKEAKKILKDPIDAIGINAKVAAQLSGADFDGDSVLVIPTAGTDLKAMKPFEKLKNFEPKEVYRAYEGMPRVGEGDGFSKQQQMGSVSNLITDMTIKNANSSDLIKAVRHSMVIIDAEKHNLNWRQSEIDNDIKNLKLVYQGGRNAGASTLISKASSEKRIPEVKEIKPDKRTGERRFIETGRTYTKKDGSVHQYTTKTTKMADEKDAYNLSSGTGMENVYAAHANHLKALANRARKEALNVSEIKYSPSARKAYAKEVAELEAGLKEAAKRKPLERQAQIVANEVIRSKMSANPEIKDDADRIKKIRNQALAEARERVGAKSYDIDITDAQWRAIQSGAISKTKLEKILDNADIDRVKSLALPRQNSTMNASTVSRIKAMRANGATQSEIAEALNISTTTVNNILRG